MLAPARASTALLLSLTTTTLRCHLTGAFTQSPREDVERLWDECCRLSDWQPGTADVASTSTSTSTSSSSSSGQAAEEVVAQ